MQFNKFSKSEKISNATQQQTGEEVILTDVAFLASIFGQAVRSNLPAVHGATISSYSLYDWRKVFKVVEQMSNKDPWL